MLNPDAVARKPLQSGFARTKPRGGPTLPEHLYTRLSFCCSKENCRRRTLPKSILFMDRRVYFRVVILIVTALNQSKPQEYTKNMLSKMVEANRKTINRWLAYFRDIFPSSQIWKTVRGFISPTVTNLGLPRSLVEYYLGSPLPSETTIINCLMLLTTGSPSLKTMEQ